MKKLLLTQLILTLLLTGCGHKKKSDDPLSHVDAEKVGVHNIEYVLNYPAFVQGVVDYKVIPRISGVIYKKYYTEGTLVKEGQPLYQVDPRPFEWELKGYEGQLIKDKAARDNYKIIYERYQDLYKARAVSKQDLELQRINYYTAVGNVTTDEADIGRTKLSLRYCLVRSPADGYIAERVVTVGTMVTAFETVLNKINSVNQMYLLFSMPDNQRLDIEEGTLDKSIEIPDDARFPIDIELASGKIIKNAGYVEFTDTRIALTNGSWNMRAYVDNVALQNKLLAGQYVTVYIRNIRYLNTFSLPQAAVMQNDTGQYVYLVKEHKAVKRYIKTGKMYGNGLWMIKSGLEKDDIVITKGNIRVDAGQTVFIDKLKEA
ncbi:MAG: efflux RND transporter periplasmic adaptor subunit [Gammaproteobacteria bacterium]|nr:efflux RND transporter periplasmic adaptor subunit [Gammaproteobacteria bacterium]